MEINELSSCQLTYERYGVSSDRQQVVGAEQEDGVAQDQGHLEQGPVNVLCRQHKTEEVHCDEETAGDQEVHNVHDRLAADRDLQPRLQTHAERG